MMSPSRPEAGVVRETRAARGETRTQFRSIAKLSWLVEYETVDHLGPNIDAFEQALVRDTDTTTNTRDAPVRRYARTFGVGVGGTFVITRDLLPVGTRLRMWLHVPTPAHDAARLIALHGEIRWVCKDDAVRPRGFGVRFRALTPAAEIELHACFSDVHGVV